MSSGTMMRSSSRSPVTAFFQRHTNAEDAIGRLQGLESRKIASASLREMASAASDPPEARARCLSPRRAPGCRVPCATCPEMRYNRSMLCLRDPVSQ